MHRFAIFGVALILGMTCCQFAHADDPDGISLLGVPYGGGTGAPAPSDLQSYQIGNHWTYDEAYAAGQAEFQQARLLGYTRWCVFQHTYTDFDTGIVYLQDANDPYWYFEIAP